MLPPSDSTPLDDLLARSSWVRALAARLVDRTPDGDADDLAQDVYVAALVRANGAEVRSPAAWLAGTARNLVRRARRDGARRRTREAQVARTETGGDPCDLVAKAELQGRLIRAVTALEEPLRTTLLLRYFEGLSPSAIAARAGVPASTVRTRLARGLERLRAELDREHRGDRSAWCAALGDLAGPLLSTGTTAGAAATTAAITGVLTMKAWMPVGAVVALVAVTAVGLRSWNHVERAGRESRAAAAPTPLEPAPPAESVLELAGAAEHPDAGRRAVPVAAVVDRGAPPHPRATGAAPPALATVLARLVDEQGAPLSGGTLSVRGRDEAARSAADGRVDLALEPSEDGHVLVASHSGRATRYVRATLKPGGTSQLGDLVLVPGGVLHGTVLDSSGRPVDGARVFVAALENERVDPATLRRLGPYLTAPVHGADAADDGGFRLAGVTPGAARLWATAPGHGFVARGPLEVAVGPNPPVELVLPSLAGADVIAGVVLAPDGAPARASVSYHYVHGDSHQYRTMKTGEDGRFALTVASRSPHHFVFVDPERRWAAIPVLGVMPGGAELDVRFRETPFVRLRVSDERGRPIEAFQVSLDDARGREPHGAGMLEGRRGSGGALELPAPPVAFLVSVTATGYEQATLGPFAPDAAPGEIVVRLVGLPGIEGAVTAGGRPVAGAALHLADVYGDDTLALRNGFRCRYIATSPVTETDEEGRFRLFAPRAGTFVVRAEAEGFAPGELELDVDPGRAVRGLELALGAGGTITGRVLLPAGEDPAGLVVGANHGDGRPLTQRVGADGTFTFANLASGGWHLGMRDEELIPGLVTESFSGRDHPEPFSISCRVHEGETTRFDIDLRGRSGGRLHGRLLLASGAYGWSAALRRIDAGTLVESDVAADTLDAGGTFELAHPEAGRYRLILGAPRAEARLRIETTLELPAGDATWELELPLGALIGAFADGHDARDGEVLLYRWKGTLPAALGSETAMTVRFAPDASGAFHLPDVPAGPGELVRYREDERGLSRPDAFVQVTVPEGRIVTVAVP